MKRRFPRPNEVRGVGSLKPGVARFGEAQTMLSTFAVAQVDGRRWDEIEVVGVEAKNAEQLRHAHEVAGDYAFKIANAPLLPLPDMFAGKELHANENIDRRYDLAGLEEVGHRALDSWEKRIAAKGRDGHRWFALPRHAE
jgi:hypothetical protein